MNKLWVKKFSSQTYKPKFGGVKLLIDCHMHCFPDKLAAGTMEKLSAICGTVPNTDGTLQGTLDFIDRNGLDAGIMLPIATSAHSQRNVNDFAWKAQAESKGKLFAFGSVHPFAPDAIEELHRIAEMGIRGIKLHPDYQDFYFQDTRCYPIYEEISALGLVLTIHAGFDPVSPNDIHAPVSALVQVAQDFPKLTLIGAHMGGLGFGAEPDKRIFDLPNVWFDTAVLPSCYKGRESLFAEHLRRRGADHILFGTDCPWDTVENIQDFLERQDLSGNILDQIYYKNAQELLHIHPGL